MVRVHLGVLIKKSKDMGCTNIRGKRVKLNGRTPFPRHTKGYGLEELPAKVGMRASYHRSTSKRFICYVGDALMGKQAKKNIRKLREQFRLKK